MAGQNKNLAGPDAMTLEECGPYGCGYHKFAVFQFLVVICVTYWLFTMLWMGMYLIQKVPPAGTEFMIYAVFNVLILIAFSTSWTECNETIVDPTYPVCKRATGAKASIAFAMFTWLALCVSMMFTWKEWRDQNYEGLPIFGDFSSFMPGGGGGGMGGGGGYERPSDVNTQTYA
ncbi:uncharacterized protein MICPUCDRAFT_53157 [Micromonas pusilla CCMP1545]|jgi:hypothetical protein|nr:uncharacterized protein MICPUCDRAFT_53157 [Micromonas pusilla CCMP1545]EEH52411.1 predicted protein [Micromonas pusilla CCMP1545]|tara:strand:+ start:585 stop:1106 length:522 start_codon:yes stop_codon:yes gene_type:complete|eukprot:XP_003063275.1 predicted protein [Micromonas pusilla CCMP1545]